MESVSVTSLKSNKDDDSTPPENWGVRHSDSPRKPVKSTAVVKYSTAQNLANFACLQCNTDLNMPPSNWLSSTAESYGLQPVPSHSSGFSSFRMAHMFPDVVGEVDVVSDAENIKKLLKIPYSKTPVSMMVHRVENTLLIDEFDIHKHLMRTAETEWVWLKTFFFDNILKSLKGKEKGFFPKNNSRCALQQKSLVSKFLYHSLAVAATNSGLKEQTENSANRVEVPKPMPVETPLLPEPSLEEKVPDPSSSHTFTRNVVWTFENIQMLIGTDLPIFGGTTHPCISLKLRDMSKPINVLTGIDYWLDNLMCNVPELVMCYHLNGIVQKYELVKTEDLPHLEDSKFSPKVIRDVAQNILSFLKSNATKAGHTYWLFKGKDDDAVKLYDLTSLCTADIMDDKGQNPFTVPVAMLLYRVARNMKLSTDNARHQGTIRMLLKNCLALLVKEKYPQIVTSAHYMLSDVYIPAETDPSSPGLCGDDIDTSLNTTHCDQEDEAVDVASSSSVAVKSLFLSMTEEERLGEDDRKYSTPLPVNYSVEERCRKALHHVSVGLHCLQYFDVEVDGQCKADESSNQDTQKKHSEEENPNIARPFQAIPMPYTSLHSQNGSETKKVVGQAQPAEPDKKTNNSKKKKRDARRERESKSKHKEESNDSDNSPKALLCKTKVEAMPNWQLHLKVLLYEKACLVYATLAESEFNLECYGRALRYMSSVLKCNRVFGNLANSVPNVALQSYLLGRAGDCCFMIAHNLTRLEYHREEYARLSQEDIEIMAQVKKDSEEYNCPIDEIPDEISTYEQMLIASCECYKKALLLQPQEQQKSNLHRRLGSMHNELGAMYMNQAMTRFQDEKSSENFASIFQVLFTKSLHHLESGIHLFEIESDDANLALLHSNTGRLMRMCAHYYSPASRSEFVGKERQFFNKAFTSYQRAMQVLATRATNPAVWDTVTWELSSMLFNMASVMQDFPSNRHQSTEEMEREVVEYLQKALKYCDLETPGTRHPVYQFRAASIHHRLASFYHKSFRSLAADDSKRKNILQLSKLHYDKASNLFLLLERPPEFLRAQLEHVALFEFQAQNAFTMNGKLKLYQIALELIFQCQPILKCMVDRIQSVDTQTEMPKDGKPPSNTVLPTRNSLEDSCSEEQINQDITKDHEELLLETNCGSRKELPVNEDDLAEQREEYNLLKLLEQRLQFILLKLTHLYTNGLKPGQAKKESEAQGLMYRSFYSLSLKKCPQDTSHDLCCHLLNLSREIGKAMNNLQDRANAKLS